MWSNRPNPKYDLNQISKYIFKYNYRIDFMFFGLKIPYTLISYSFLLIDYISAERKIKKHGF